MICNDRSIIVDTNPATYCPNGATTQSPGLAALFAAYPGEGSYLRSTLKGLSHGATLPGLMSSANAPGVGRKKRGQPRALSRCPFRAAPIKTKPI